uniref:CCHC-type domain-containing protein n=1 Tax=Bombyx mori TaxID=7091 RepID=A0A8R2MA73_BOMMO|nr:uncharacterized protein LOC119630951 [Bombyx mori]
MEESMEARFKENLPQEGTRNGESLPEPSIGGEGSPSYSGGGKILQTTQKREMEEEEQPVITAYSGDNDYSDQGSIGESFEVSSVTILEKDWEQVEDPFKRRESIKRTPPGALKELKTPSKMADSGTLVQEDIFLTPKEKIAEVAENTPMRPKKRKKLSSPIVIQPAEAEPPVEYLKLKTKIDKLVKFGKENKNVHRQIKDLLIDLPGLMERVTIRYKDDTNKPTEMEQKFEAYKKEQEEKIRRLEQEIKELKTLHKRETGENQLFKLDDQMIDSYDDFSKVSSMDWTQDSYKRTKIGHGDIFLRTTDCIVYFCDEREKAHSRLTRRVLSRYPEVTKSEKMACAGGAYVTVERETTIKTKEGRQTDKTSAVIMFHDATKQDGRSQKDMYELLSELTKIVEEMGNKELTIIKPQGIDTGVTRKMLEVLFRGKDIKLELRTPKKGENTNNTETRKRDDVIVIEGGTTTYADTVKRLKEGIKGTASLENIKGVKKTAKGQVLVRVMGNIEEMTGKIREMMGDRKVRRTGGSKKKVLHIKGMDSSVEMEEVREDLKSTNLIKKVDSLEIRSLRPMGGGNQTATVILDEEDAGRLLAGGKIRVGLNICHIHERIELLRCYRCWEYGHKAENCNGEDRSKACRRCSEAGHIAGVCVNEQFCPLCSKKGHTAGTGRCPLFREALETAKRSQTYNKNGF